MELANKAKYSFHVATMDRLTRSRVKPEKRTPSKLSQEVTFLDEFKPFPRLDLDVRLQIWRTTFPPPQTVVLAEHLYNHVPHMGYGYSFDEVLAIAKRRKLSVRPVALRVNSESRREALRAYGIVLPPKVFSIPAAVDEIIFPLCFAPGKDLVSINVNFISGALLLAKMKDIQNQAPGKLEKIESLEITHLKTASMFFSGCREYVGGSWNHWYKNNIDEKKTPTGPMDGILLFKKLKTLTVLIDLQPWQSSEPQDIFEECYDVLRACLERNKHQFDGGEVPKIFVAAVNVL